MLQLPASTGSKNVEPTGSPGHRARWRIHSTTQALWPLPTIHITIKPPMQELRTQTVGDAKYVKAALTPRYRAGRRREIATKLLRPTPAIVPPPVKKLICASVDGEHVKAVLGPRYRAGRRRKIAAKLLRPTESHCRPLR